MNKKLLIPVFILMLLSLACNLSADKVAEQPTPQQQQQAVATAVIDQPDTNTQVSSGAVNNIDDVQAAVFQIIGTGTINDIDQGEILNAEWGGTGFFIDSNGIGVTNNHVVAGAAILKAYVNGETTPRSIKVLGKSECSDLAVVQVEGNDFPYLEWFDGTIKTGLDVYAAGFPLVEPEYNLTKGIISKTNANGQTNWSSLSYIYGHDAKINGGNSGGPLVTSDGKVVGINYMARASVDQQFAIPSELAIPVVNQLKDKKDVSSLGISGIAVTFGPNNEYPGIWVESTATGSIADKVGVEPGDIIHEIEDILVATDGTMKEYCEILGSHDESDPMKIMVYRWQTDELLEGTLNGSALAFTNYAGLSGDTSGDTGDSTSDSTYTSGIMEDNFDGNVFDEGWSYLVIGDESNYLISQKPGRVYMEINTTDTITYLFHDTFWASDVYVESEVTKVGGPNRMNSSIVCRASDVGWYEFSITSGGYWDIWKYYNGTFESLASGPSQYINVQSAPNLLQAECKGTDLTFWVNEKFVGSTTDRDMTEGQVGFSLTTLDLKGARVEFEYLYAEPE
jgi:S1-C subfamily serine protease